MFPAGVFYLRVCIRLVPILLLSLVVRSSFLVNTLACYRPQRPAVGPRLLIRRQEHELKWHSAYIAANRQKYYLYYCRPFHYPPPVDAFGGSQSLPPAEDVILPWSRSLLATCFPTIISLPCPMYERRRLHKLSTGNPFCSPPVLPFRPGFCRPIERYHRSTVSSDHLADVFRA